MAGRRFPPPWSVEETDPKLDRWRSLPLPLEDDPALRLRNVAFKSEPMGFQVTAVGTGGEQMHGDIVSAMARHRQVECLGQMGNGIAASRRTAASGPIADIEPSSALQFAGVVASTL